MRISKTFRRHDKALGLDAPIARRDFLNSTLLASGSILLRALAPLRLLAQQEGGNASWDGPGGIGDYSEAHGNSFEVVNAAHGIRDGAYDQLPADALDTGELFDCVVVGGGISGLSAALFFKNQAGPRRSCLVLENHAMFGAEARRNEFMVDGQRLMAPQGSVQFPIPYPGGLIDRFYREVGFNYWEFQVSDVGGSRSRSTCGQNRLHAVGAFAADFRLLLRSKVRPAAGHVDDRSHRQEARRSADFQCIAR